MPYDKGHAEVDGARLRCWKRGGHGLQTYLEVVQNSCNPGFVELGERLGKEKLFKYIKDFGFGQKRGLISKAREQASYSRLREWARWSKQLRFRTGSIRHADSAGCSSIRRCKRRNALHTLYCKGMDRSCYEENGQKTITNRKETSHF